MIQRAGVSVGGVARRDVERVGSVCHPALLGVPSLTGLLDVDLATAGANQLH